MLDSVGDELFVTGVGNGRLISHPVVGATGFGSIEEVLGVCYGGCCCSQLLGKRRLLCLFVEGRRR